MIVVIRSLQRIDDQSGILQQSLLHSIFNSVVIEFEGVGIFWRYWCIMLRKFTVLVLYTGCFLCFVLFNLTSCSHFMPDFVDRNNRIMIDPSPSLIQ